jgi:hypothetical protein
MAFSYCPHCGYKNMYSMQAPKFCGGCGETLSILSAAKNVSSSKSTVSKNTLRPRRPLRRRPVEEEVDDPDASDVYEVPHITSLSYKIEQDNNKFSLKDMVPLEELEDTEAPKQKKPTKAKKRGRPRKQ